MGCRSSSLKDSSSPSSGVNQESSTSADPDHVHHLDPETGPADLSGDHLHRPWHREEASPPALVTQLSAQDRTDANQAAAEYQERVRAKRDQQDAWAAKMQVEWFDPIRPLDSFNVTHRALLGRCWDRRATELDGISFIHRVLGVDGGHAGMRPAGSTGDDPTQLKTTPVPTSHELEMSNTLNCGAAKGSSHASSPGVPRRSHWFSICGVSDHPGAPTVTHPAEMPTGTVEANSGTLLPTGVGPSPTLEDKSAPADGAAAVSGHGPLSERMVQTTTETLKGMSPSQREEIFNKLISLNPRYRGIKSNFAFRICEEVSVDPSTRFLRSRGLRPASGVTILRWNRVELFCPNFHSLARAVARTQGCPEFDGTLLRQGSVPRTPTDGGWAVSSTTELTNSFMSRQLSFVGQHLIATRDNFSFTRSRQGSLILSGSHLQLQAASSLFPEDSVVALAFGVPADQLPMLPGVPQRVPSGLLGSKVDQQASSAEGTTPVRVALVINSFSTSINPFEWERSRYTRYPVDVDCYRSSARRTYGEGCITDVMYGGILVVECSSAEAASELQSILREMTWSEARTPAAILSDVKKILGERRARFTGVKGAAPHTVAGSSHPVRAGEPEKAYRYRLSRRIGGRPMRDSVELRQICVHLGDEDSTEREHSISMSPGGDIRTSSPPCSNEGATPAAVTPDATSPPPPGDDDLQLDPDVTVSFSRVASAWMGIGALSAVARTWGVHLLCSPEFAQPISFFLQRFSGIAPVLRHTALSSVYHQGGTPSNADSDTNSKVELAFYEDDLEGYRPDPTLAHADKKVIPRYNRFCPSFPPSLQSSPISLVRGYHGENRVERSRGRGMGPRCHSHETLPPVGTSQCPLGGELAPPSSCMTAQKPLTCSDRTSEAPRERVVRHDFLAVGSSRSSHSSSSTSSESVTQRSWAAGDLSHNETVAYNDSLVQLHEASDEADPPGPQHINHMPPLTPGLEAADGALGVASWLSSLSTGPGVAGQRMLWRSKGMKAPANEMGSQHNHHHLDPNDSNGMESAIEKEHSWCMSVNSTRHHSTVPTPMGGSCLIGRRRGQEMENLWTMAVLEVKALQQDLQDIQLARMASDDHQVVLLAQLHCLQRAFLPCTQAQKLDLTFLYLKSALFEPEDIPASRVFLNGPDWFPLVAALWTSPANRIRSVDIAAPLTWRDLPKVGMLSGLLYHKHASMSLETLQLNAGGLLGDSSQLAVSEKVEGSPMKKRGLLDRLLRRRPKKAPSHSLMLMPISSWTVGGGQRGCPPFYVSPEQARDCIWLLLCSIAENAHTSPFRLCLKDFPCDELTLRKLRKHSSSSFFSRVRRPSTQFHMKESSLNLNSFVTMGSEVCHPVENPSTLTLTNDASLEFPPLGTRSRVDDSSATSKVSPPHAGKGTRGVHHHHAASEEWMHHAAHVFSYPFTMLLYHDCQSVPPPGSASAAVEHYHHPYNELHNHRFFYRCPTREAALEHHALQGSPTQGGQPARKVTAPMLLPEDAYTRYVFGLQSAAEEADVLSQEELRLTQYASDIWVVLTRAVENYNSEQCRGVSTSARPRGASKEDADHRLWKRQIILERGDAAA